MLIPQEFKDFTWLEQYCKYLTLRDKGLNSDAREAIHVFIKAFQLQSTEEQRRFIDKLFIVVFKNKDNKNYLPHDLYQEIVKPGLSKWQQDEPWNSIPFRWSDRMADLKYAVQLNRTDQIALDNYFSRSISAIQMNQHETDHGYGYHGNPQTDILLLEELKQLIPLITADPIREQLQQQILQLTECARRYI
jgi:hypothetical protein